MRPLPTSALALLLPACSTNSVSTPTAALTSTPPSIVYAEVERAPAAIPARFEAPLPATVEAFRGDWSAHPPRTMVEAQLCKGVPAMWEKLGTATGAAMVAGGSPDQVRQLYGGLLNYCYDPASCEQAARWVDGTPEGSVRAWLGWLRLGECSDEATLTRFRTEGPPDEAMVRFWFERTWEAPGEYVPSLSATLQRVATGDDSWLARRAAVAYGKLDDPRIAAELLAAHAAATDPAVKDQIVAGLHEQSDPQAKALFAAHCAREDVREALCPRDEPYAWEQDLEPPREPEAVLADQDLIRRVVNGDDYRASWKLYGALRDIASEDWTRAREAAGPLMAAPTLEPGLQDLVRTLERFETRQAIADKLRTLGLLKGEAPVEGWLDAADLLTLTGRVHGFDCETGMYPNEHDGLLAELAAMAGPPMSGVVFLESAPPLEEAGELGELSEPVIDVVIGEDGRVWEAPSPHGSYLLHAFTGKERLTVAAEDLGDWYDLHAVLGLLNTTARQLDQDVRFVTLPTGDQTALVLVAAPSMIQAAVEAGVLRLEQVGAAAADGKAFEAEALLKLMEQLDKSGGVPE
jgi:hypothetical protein